MAITDRDLDILKILYKRRVVSRDQLIYLSGLGSRSQAKNIINKRLRVLQEAGLIEKMQPHIYPGEGSSQQLVTLGRAGANLLGVKWKPYFKRVHVARDYVQFELPINTAHKLALVDAEIMIRRKCADAGYTLYRLLYEEGGKTGPVVPDLTAVVINGDVGETFYVEIDRGTESLEYVRKKVNRYNNLKISGIWGGAEYLKIFPTPTFPILIIASTGTNNRIRHIGAFIAGVGLVGYSIHLSKLYDYINVGRPD